MTGTSVILVVVAVAAFFIFRRIAKLPSRYERNPRKLSAWNSLDQGIDPTLSLENETSEEEK